MRERAEERKKIRALNNHRLGSYCCLLASYCTTTMEIHTYSGVCSSTCSGPSVNAPENEPKKHRPILTSLWGVPNEEPLA